jgi:hypothetical protein
MDHTRGFSDVTAVTNGAFLWPLGLKAIEEIRRAELEEEEAVN